MNKFKGVLLGGGVFALAFAWKVFIGILVFLTVFFVIRKLIDIQYNKGLDGKWD